MAKMTCGPLLCVMVLLLLSACSPAAPPTAPPPTETAEPTIPAVGLAPQAIEDPALPSPVPAIHTSLWWDVGIGERDMQLVADLPGFNWVKQKFAWRDIETLEKGAYDWWRADLIVENAEAHGLNLVVRLDRQPFWSQADGGELPLENAPPENYQDFGDYCSAVAERYRGRIAAYQVWNEPNLAREWGGSPPDPVAYTELLRVCSEGIRQGDPNALIISAGLAPTGSGPPLAMPDDMYLTAMYEAGAANYFDILGVNAPGYGAPPETSPEEVANTPELGGARWTSFRRVEDMRRIMVAQGDEARQMAILEMGWTTDPVNPEYAWFAVTEEQQADYLVRAYEYAYENWRPWMTLMTTIFLPDPNWTPEDEEYWWGIVFPGVPEPVFRPAYDALKQVPDWHGQE